LQKNQTPRGTITKTTAFKSLTETKLIKNYPIRDPHAPPTKLNIHPEADAFLKAVGWSQDTFISKYSRLFETMSNDPAITPTHRLAPEHATRLYATTALGFTIDSKNRHRDWDKVILPVVIEAGIIETYREKLLLACPLARRLRKEIHDFFHETTPLWKQIDTGSMRLRTDKRWIFADNIYVDAQGDNSDIATEDNTPRHTSLRTEFQEFVAKKSALKKKKTKKKDGPAPQTTSTTAPDNSTTPVNTDTPAPTPSTKDPGAHKKSDDIQSLMSSLKSIQKHRLLQCSEKDAPAGSTESIVSYAVYIIGRVYVLSSLPLPPSLTILPQVAHLNKARIEHEDKQKRSRKGKEKQTDFDMSSVAIPDLNLAAHAVSLDYYDAVHIPLYPIFRPPNLSFFPARLWRPSHQACKKIQCPPSDTGSYTSFLLNGHLFHTSFLPIGHSQQPHSYVSPLTLLPARSSQPVR